MGATFRGNLGFLSNFYPSPIWWEGRKWPTVEHAYQAAKNLDYADLILSCKSPGEAKYIGGIVSIRSDWDSVKVDIMRELVQLKFEQNSELLDALIQTEGKLEEGNTWHDTFWGVCYCDSCGGIGENMLGKILMEIRDGN